MVKWTFEETPSPISCPRSLWMALQSRVDSKGSIPISQIFLGRMAVLAAGDNFREMYVLKGAAGTYCSAEETTSRTPVTVRNLEQT